MTSRSGDRPGRTLGGLLLGLLAFLIIVFPTPAYAHDVGAGVPDAGNQWTYCNVNVNSATIRETTGLVTYFVRCQLPSNSTTHYTQVYLNFTFRNSTGAVQGRGLAKNIASGVTRANSRVEFTLTDPGTTGCTAAAGCNIQFGVVSPTSTAVDESLTEQKWDAALECSTSPTPCNPTGAKPGAVLAVKVAAGMPAFPAHWWTGGDAGPAAEECTSGDPDCADLLDEGGNANDTEDCGSWWNIACHFRNVMRWVFVPSRDMGQDVNDIADAAAEHYPFGPVIEGVSLGHGVFEGFTNGVTAGQTSESCSWDVQMPSTWPHNAGTDPPEFTLLDLCEGSVVVANGGNFILWVSRFMLIVAFVFAMLRIGQWAMGTGSLGGGGDDE